MNTIVDCFLFFNELNILKFRLKELNESVDYFVLVESPQTFTGNPKPLYYEENKHLFSEYNHKIIHIVAKEIQDVGAWDRESHQRNAIAEGIDKLNLKDTDVIVISDCDEITNSTLLSHIKEHGFNIFKDYNNPEFCCGNFCSLYETEEVFGLIQDFYYYNLESKKPGTWNWSKILTYKKLKEIGSPQELRRNYDVKGNWYCKGGWHFSYFGGVDQIIQKIQSFSHTEFNTEYYTNRENIIGQISQHKDIFFREGNEDLRYIPINENDNLPINYKMLL